jgi:hypothetical protein
LYLPTLDRSQVLALLAGAHRRRGVAPPIDWKPPVATPSITAG